jgi:D-ribulokinase
MQQKNAIAQHRGPVVVGVDVGSASVRAGVFDSAGTMLGFTSRSLVLYRESGHMVEQSGGDIWRSLCEAVKAAISISEVDPATVSGIGIDATCSLVVVGPGGAPLPVGPSEDPTRNVIVWMDHRATEQADAINATRHQVLQYVGGTVSPEMETPKLLWLKTHRREVYDAAWQFFDLADYLTWRATGDLSRSVCTVTCKWTYLAHEQRWDPDYFHRIGLGDLADDHFRRIGERVVAPGTPCGQGLTAEASRKMGLPEGIPVAAGLIDAHAGGIGSLGGFGDVSCHMAYVFGTSSCTLTSTLSPVLIPGVWGPYYSAMVPGLWLNEGGQSAAGAAIKRLLAAHPATPQAMIRAAAVGVSLPNQLAQEVMDLVTCPSDAVALADGLHVVPEFLGNRAPFADPQARAVIAGLSIDDDGEDGLLARYVAGVCSIGYGLRQIIEAQKACGVKVNGIVISGGAGRHPLVRQLLADACGCKILTCKANEPVLLGAAMLGAVAGGIYPVVADAMAQMGKPDGEYRPSVKSRGLHRQRYAAYRHLQKVARGINTKEKRAGATIA